MNEIADSVQTKKREQEREGNISQTTEIERARKYFMMRFDSANSSFLASLIIRFYRKKLKTQKSKKFLHFAVKKNVPNQFFYY